MKKIIKLTESDLTRIIERVINESSNGENDKRYERMIDKLVMSYYPKVKYRKQGSVTYIFVGDTFSRAYRVRNGEFKKSNTIMSYSSFDDRLSINLSALKPLEPILPILNDVKMIKYFIKSMTKLFADKFGFTPRIVHISDKSIMDKIESTPDI
jgi:hypothetical protein